MGLLAYMAGGALKGVGDAMVNKAKQEREDTLLALAEANKRTDMATEQNYRTDNIKQQGDIQGGLEDKRIGGEKEIAGINNTAADKRTDKTLTSEEKRSSAAIAGEDRRSAATNATSRANTQDTTAAARYSADARKDASLARVAQLANQGANGKPLTYNQALLAARQAYSENYKAGIPMTDSNGDPIPAEEWAKTKADKLMQDQPAARAADSATFVNQSPDVIGGGLLNPGATSMPSLPVPSPSLTPAPTVSTGVSGPDISKATATATNPKTGQKIYQVGNQWVDTSGKPVQ